MHGFMTLAALALMINGAIAIWRMMRARSSAEHVLPLLLLGTNASAIFLLLAEVMAEPAARDVAFVFAVLAALTSLAFSHRLWWRLPRGGGR